MSCPINVHHAGASLHHTFGIAARNKAKLEGLLSIFPVACTDASQLPILSDNDQAALTYLSKQFEIDFLCLSFTEHAKDIHAARKFLALLGLDKTKVKLHIRFMRQMIASWM